jgi:hypothetical protein
MTYQNDPGFGRRKPIFRNEPSYIGWVVGCAMLVLAVTIGVYAFLSGENTGADGPTVVTTVPGPKSGAVTTGGNTGSGNPRATVSGSK